MYEEFLGKKDEGNIGRETADEVIAHMQELLDDNFYDEEAWDEAIAMLNKARLSTEDTQAIAQIDVLLEDIETQYRDDIWIISS